MNHLSFFFLSAHDEMLNRRIKTQQHQLLLPMVTILKLMLFLLQNLEMESLWWELKKNTIFLNSMYTPALRHVLINWVKNYSWNDLKFKLDRIKISQLKYNSLFFYSPKSNVEMEAQYVKQFDVRSLIYQVHYLKHSLSKPDFGNLLFSW